FRWTEVSKYVSAVYLARSGWPGSRQASAYSPGSARMWIGIGESLKFRGPMTALKEPTLQEILSFCAEDPVERVFLEDVARRGLGRFTALERDGGLAALCHVGSNVVPSGSGCGAFAEVAAAGSARMLIGEEHAVTQLWDSACERLPEPREDRPGQPVYVLGELPEPGDTGLRPATREDFDLLVPACAAAHLDEIGMDPLARDPESFPWRTRIPIVDRRSSIWSHG